MRLILGALLFTAVFLFVRQTTSSYPSARRLKARSQTVISGSRHNGVSFMDVEDTDEWLSEEDLFYSQYTEDTPLSAEDAAAEAEMESRKADVIEQNRQQSLRALTWWLAEGGEIPSDWEVPSKAYLKKVGGRGVERLLEDIEDVELGDEPMFEEGWADFAKKRYRIVVFSKTHCPYSRKAKQILSQYHLSPAPFIVELDTRPDSAQIQDLLLHLTGRRTVPNILLDFASVGGSDDLTLMHSEGGLQRRFEEMGALPGRGRPVQPPLQLPAIAVPAAGAAAKQQDKAVKAPPAHVAQVEDVEDIPEDQENDQTEEDADDEFFDDDDESSQALIPGANPADIRAAVQAAHGDDYLLDGDDDDAFAGSEEFGGSEIFETFTQDDQLVPAVNDDLEPDFDNDVFDDDDWEADGDEEEEEGIAPVPAVADKAKAAAEAVKAKAAALAEEARVKAAAAAEEVKAKAAKAAEEAKAKAAAPVGAKKVTKPKAKGKGLRKPNPKAEPVNLPVPAPAPVAKAPVKAAPAGPEFGVLKPVAQRPQQAKQQPKQQPPPPAPVKQQPVQAKPVAKVLAEKADTLLDRANANALQKKKAAVQAVKEKARAKAGAGAGAGEKKAEPVAVKAAAKKVAKAGAGVAKKAGDAVKKAAAVVEKVGAGVKKAEPVIKKAEAVVKKAGAAVKKAGAQAIQPKAPAVKKAAPKAQAPAGKRKGRVL